MQNALAMQLRQFAQMMPEGSDIDPIIEAFASLAADAADEIERAEARGDRFQRHIFERPALNAGLIEAYTEWSGKMYRTDRDGFVREPEEIIAAIKARP